MNKYYHSIFQKKWWLDAVAPSAWNEVKVKNNDGDTVAIIPYVVKKRYGFTLLTMPPLTQTLGPWLDSYSGKYTSRLSKEKKLMTDLITGLPKFDFFRQNFHYSITNWLPFHWAGFEQTARYTYVIDNLSDPDKVWKEARENIRREVRKAKKKVGVRTDLGLEAFLDLNEMTFQRQGLALPYSRRLVSRLDKACNDHNCRKMFFAEDSQGRLHAAIYIVWDEKAAYYLMGGANPELRNSGATSLLMWEAIQFASTVTQTFDFEGSMIEPVERFFRAFGARQKIFFTISKANSLPLKMGQDVHSWWEMLRGK